MNRIIQLPGAEVEYTDFGCSTRLPDGSHYEAWPGDDPHYRIVAFECGYGDDILAFAREHECCHVLVAARILKRPTLLWYLARGFKVPPEISVPEEATVQLVQKYLRSNREPIIGDFDWDALKAEAVRLLGKTTTGTPD